MGATFRVFGSAWSSVFLERAVGEVIETPQSIQSFITEEVFKQEQTPLRVEAQILHLSAKIRYKIRYKIFLCVSKP